MKPNTKLTPNSITKIIRKFDTGDLVIPFDAQEVSSPLSLEASIMLFGRLERAAGNQITEGAATVSRYSIWAETVRGIILDAINSLDESPRNMDTKRNLTKAANSLAAFSTIQNRIDYTS